MGKRFSRTVRLHVCCRTPDHDLRSGGDDVILRSSLLKIVPGLNFCLLHGLTSFCPIKNLVVLWPLFHYILWDEATDGRVEKKNWDDYVFVNQQFADAILEQYQPGDIGKTREIERTKHNAILHNCTMTRTSFQLGRN